jgi:hypothetical protein
MSQQTRGIGGRTAEDLLDGADGASPYPLLAATLRAAAGPTRPGELAGRQAAVAAFRLAVADAAGPAGRRSRIRRPVLRLTLRAAVVAAVVLGTGGVAVAASTGAIPIPLNKHHAVPSAPASTPHPGVSPDPSNHTGSGAGPSPALVGLCQAYDAGAGSDHGKALENPAFQALITAAGGKDAVDGYCARLLATANPSRTPGGHPSTTPPGHADDHATGKPSDHPTGHTTGKPTAPPGH